MMKESEYLITKLIIFIRTPKKIEAAISSTNILATIIQTVTVIIAVIIIV